MTDTIIIKQLHIQRFRGIENLKWNPSDGINLILGGGDCGKTTILEAVGLLFSPTNSISLTEADYWQRELDDGFRIEAAISVPTNFDFTSGNKIFWPWEWDGENAVLPVADEEDGVPEAQVPVFRVAVAGSGDFDLSWEVIQPDDSVDHFSVGIRRQIGLVRLSGDERNDRDLRLVYGSALDRLLSDNTIRSKITNEVSKIDLSQTLSEDAKKALSDLDESMKTAQLPNELDLGLTSSQGISIGALVGLLAKEAEITLPLTSWGAGTRRMAALQIASASKEKSRITIIDEIERGLEPYRLRTLIGNLSAENRQSFVTSHSTVAISCSKSAQLWYLDAAQNIGVLDHDKISAQQQRDPETFLARQAVIVEGDTEVGFLQGVLKAAFGADPLDSGTRICNGQGNQQCLALLEALGAAGVSFSGFVDNEGTQPGRWQTLKQSMGDRLFQWDEGCLESNVIPLFDEEQLENLIKDSEGNWIGERLRTLAIRLGEADKSIENIKAKAAEQGTDLRVLIIAAATGSTDGAPEEDKKAWKRHSERWFKSVSGGQELLKHLVDAKKWSEFEPAIRSFINAVLLLSGKDQLDEIVL